MHITCWLSSLCSYLAVKISSTTMNSNQIEQQPDWHEHQQDFTVDKSEPQVIGESSCARSIELRSSITPCLLLESCKAFNFTTSCKSDFPSSRVCSEWNDEYSAYWSDHPLNNRLVWTLLPCDKQLETVH